MQTRVLQLVAIGIIPQATLKDLEDPITQQLGLSVVAGKKPLQAPAYAYNKDRGQYHSNAIMRRLTPLIEPAQSFALGVCDVDLFVPDSQFVFGEADRESKVAVLSVNRLKQGAEPDVARRRIQVEGVHQAGHLVGLSYCEDARCVMFLAQTPQECDRKGPALCNLCRNELAKLQR